ncbi:MAG: PEP-CTERM sorting domain-containing protein [Sedimentisphaerales bacterium]
MKTRIFMSVIVSVYILFLSTAAQGVVIPLSSHSSEPAGPNSVPASWLDASMNLSVANVGYWELTLAVTNMTPETTGDIAFKMSELYFNTTAPITNLTLDSVVGGNTNDWTLTLDMDNIHVGGFGLFDISIISNSLSSVWIDPLETLTFKIMIDAGTPPYTDTDFFALSSCNIHPEHFFAYGAAKFFGGGPDDLSAYGAYVPEPATILMLGFGALALLRKRRP